MEKRSALCILSVFILITSFMLPCAFAASSIDFDKESVSPVVIKELDRPAIFNFTIRNNLAIKDYYTIDSQLDFNIIPEGLSSTFPIDAKSSKEVTAKIYFSDNMKSQYSGTRAYEYYIRSASLGTRDDSFEIKVASFKDVLSIELPESISMQDTELDVIIKSGDPVYLDGSVSIDSSLFKKIDSFSITPFDEKIIKIDLKKEDLWRDVGKYPVIITFLIDGKTIIVEKSVELKEHREISTEEKKINLIAYKSRSITKTNVGNVPESMKITTEMSSFARYFTSFSVQPTSVSNVDGKIVAVWEKELQPKEVFNLKIITNYSLPLGILAAIIIIVGVIAYLSQSRLIIKKRAIKVVTKTGEFATKIILIVKNNGKEATDIVLTDYLPIVAKVHERFGGDAPSKIEKNKIVWNAGNLGNNDSKVYSYIIYSEIKFIGALTIPKAEAYYCVDGKKKSSVSNRVHIIA